MVSHKFALQSRTLFENACYKKMFYFAFVFKILTIITSHKSSHCYSGQLKNITIFSFE